MSALRDFTAIRWKRTHGWFRRFATGAKNVVCQVMYDPRCYCIAMQQKIAAIQAWCGEIDGQNGGTAGQSMGYRADQIKGSGS